MSILQQDHWDATIGAVLEAFDLGSTRFVRPLGGTATPKFEVEVPRGRFVVRARPGEFATVPMTQYEGLPVPSPQLRPDGRSWLVLETMTFEVLSWVDGEYFKRQDLQLLRNLGGCLARFHGSRAAELPIEKDGFVREDDPECLMPYLEQLLRLCRTDREVAQIRQIINQLNLVAEELDRNLRPRLPVAITHGDFHPGNIRFNNSAVSALYDFDYLSKQARLRDVCDSLMFFAAGHDNQLDTDDIVSLTQPYRWDEQRSRILLQGYQELLPLTDIEWEAFPWMLRSIWLQNRLRGSRKLPPEKRLAYVLDKFFEVTEWLDEEAPRCFRRLKSEMECPPDVRVDASHDLPRETQPVSRQPRTQSAPGPTRATEQNKS